MRTHTYTHAWAYLLYNKHWSKTGPSCQVTAVTTNNDYPLRAPQLLLHNHQRRGDPPLLGEQCTHEWASSSLTPTPISPLRARQTARLSICTCLWTSANLGTSVRLSFFSEHHWLHICSALLCQIITCIVLWHRIFRIFCLLQRWSTHFCTNQVTQTVSHFSSRHINKFKPTACLSSASFGGIGQPLEHILKRPHSLSALPAHV